MRFIKYILATIIGIFLFFVISFALLALVGSIASKMGGPTIESNSVLYATFSDEIVEKGSKSPFSNFNPLTLQPEKKSGLNDILSSIDKAKDDARIEGIFLELGTIPAGFATIEAIRNALLDFKQEGKWVYAYGEMISQKAYYLASVADTIMLNPTGIAEFKGFRSELMFFKGALDKLDIEAQVFKVGDYKSAVEPFILTEMSDDNREQIKEFLNDFYNIFLDGISKERSISSAELKNLANQAKITDAESAKNFNLVDVLTYKNEALNIIRTKLGKDEDDKLKFMPLTSYGVANKSNKPFAKDKIAVVYAWGNIVDGPGKNGTIGSRDYEKIIRKIREKNSAKAIVLRVNSGGGSALASDVIWNEVKTANADIPVVVSMGDYAASGGYYISAFSDYIFAEQNTLTGSIGVFGLLPNMEGFWNNKLGITFDTEKTSTYADIGTVNRKTTDEERAIIQKGVDKIYDTFLDRVAEGRDLPKEAVHEIAKGRVWSGLKAKQIGLVDEIGGLNDAIAKAAELAELENYRIVSYPEEEDPVEKLMKSLTGQTKQKMLKEELGPLYGYYNKVKEIINMKGVQARMPFELEIY